MSAPGPDAFADLREGVCRVVAVPDCAVVARALGLLEPGGLERLLAAHRGPAGRTATSVVPLPGRSERLHLRPVRRGGWLGRAGGAALVPLARPLAELRVTARLSAAGAPVPRPVLVAGRRRVGALWTAAVATVHEEDTRDGAAYLSAPLARERVLEAAQAAGRAVRALHAAGCRHADLHLKNLLFRERIDGIEALVVDLDRARLGGPLTSAERMAELMRLYRSLLKLRLLDAVGPEGCAHFLDCYTAGDRVLQHSLVAHLPRERTRLAVHALGYGR